MPVHSEFVARIGEVERVERARRIALAGQVDDRSGETLGAGRKRSRAAGQERREEGLLGRADRIVVVEGGREVLVLVGVAEAERQAQRVGDVEDIVGEDRPVGAVLEIIGEIVAHIVDGAEPVEAGDHDRRGGAERAAQRRDAGGAEASGRRRAAQRGVGADQGDQPAGGEGAILAAEDDIVAGMEILAGIIGADEPVHETAERGALEPDLLGKGLEIAERIVVVVAAQDIDIGIVGVRRRGGMIVAKGGDRRQGRATKIPVDVERDAPIGGLAPIGGAGSQREVAVVGITPRRDDAAKAGQHVDDAVAVGRAAGPRRPGVEVAGHAGRRIERLAGADIDGAAAGFVAGREIADQPDRERIVGLVHQLRAGEEAVAVVDVGFGAARRVDDIVEAVAPRVDGVDPEGEMLRERPGQADAAADVIIVAIGGLDRAAEFEFGAAGEDVNEAGRRVAAEQGPLRAAHHFDPLDRAELIEADAAARAVDAVDEHRDRAFEARIVADSADAADTGRAVSLGAGRGDEQRRGELVQLADVAGAAVLQGRAADGGDGERNLLQYLATALGGDDDLAVIGRFVGGLGGGVGRVGGARGALRVRKSGRGKRGDSRGQQPIFLHGNPSQRIFWLFGGKANVNGNLSPAKKPRFPVGLGRSLQIRNRTVAGCNLPWLMPLRKARFSRSVPGAF